MQHLQKTRRGAETIGGGGKHHSYRAERARTLHIAEWSCSGTACGALAWQPTSTLDESGCNRDSAASLRTMSILRVLPLLQTPALASPRHAAPRARLESWYSPASDARDCSAAPQKAAGPDQSRSKCL